MHRGGLRRVEIAALSPDEISYAEWRSLSRRWMSIVFAGRHGETPPAHFGQLHGVHLRGQLPRAVLHVRTGGLVPPVPLDWPGAARLLPRDGGQSGEDLH